MSFRRIKIDLYAASTFLHLINDLMESNNLKI